MADVVVVWNRYDPSAVLLHYIPSYLSKSVKGRLVSCAMMAVRKGVKITWLVLVMPTCIPTSFFYFFLRLPYMWTWLGNDARRVVRQKWLVFVIHIIEDIDVTWGSTGFFLARGMRMTKSNDRQSGMRVMKQHVRTRENKKGRKGVASTVTYLVIGQA